jgi:hypothetical protein
MKSEAKTQAKQRAGVTDIVPPQKLILTGNELLPPKCVYGIELVMKIPGRGQSCPLLHRGPGFFRRRIKRKIFIPLPLAGSKKGSGDVFGPSVCEAKFGCVCALRVQLEELRKKLGWDS